MFEFVPESRFGEEHMAAHPVWARFYDADEIDEIVSWGLDRNAIRRGLAERHDSSDHAMYPVLRTDPLPESLDLYIRADFVTADGRRLTGYLAGTEAKVVTIFWAKQQFTFSSVGLADLNADELARLRAAMGEPRAAVFPIAYCAAFRTTAGKTLAGTCSPPCN